ncbi:MAG: head-tail connector protein [Pseudomonadota bacterium]
MSLTQIAGPALEPVTVVELKTHLRVETSDEDAFLNDLVRTARQQVEAMTGKSLITQQWLQVVDGNRLNALISILPSPVRSIDSLTINAADNTTSVLSPGDYSADLISDPARLKINSSLVGARCFNGLEIRVTTGFGDLPTDVPDGLKRAIVVLAGHWFEHRTEAEYRTGTPAGLDLLLAPYQRLSI